MYLWMTHTPCTHKCAGTEAPSSTCAFCLEGFTHDASEVLRLISAAESAPLMPNRLLADNLREFYSLVEPHQKRPQHGSLNVPATEPKHRPGAPSKPCWSLRAGPHQRVLL